MIESSQEREQKPMQISSAITPELHSTPQQVYYTKANMYAILLQIIWNHAARAQTPIPLSI